jgi:hypothetical protein
MVDECEYCGLELDECTCSEPVAETRHSAVNRVKKEHDYQQEELLMRYHYAQTQHQNDQNR